MLNNFYEDFHNNLKGSFLPTYTVPQETLWYIQRKCTTFIILGGLILI